MASTNWLGTLNNPEVDPKDFLEQWSKVAVYVVG